MPDSHRHHRTENLRPLNGISVEGGRLNGKPIWRSDNLMLSPSEEVKGLRVLGLRTAIDLRSPDEVEAHSTAVFKENEVIHLRRPMTQRAADPKTLARTLGAIETPEQVGEWYFRLTMARANTLIACLEDIATAPRGVVFYCEVGKDRTGVLAATLLKFLGATDESVVDDYGKTNKNISRIHARRDYLTGRPALSGVYPHHPILFGLEDSMWAFLSLVREFGGIEAVLVAGSRQSKANDDSLEGSDFPNAKTFEGMTALRERLQKCLVV